MLIPTLPFKILRKSGTDVYGQPKFAKLPDEKCAPVRLKFDAQHTTVRTDSSATRGHATELTASVVILVTPASKVLVDDVLELLGHKVKVSSRHPRYTVTGRLDHFQLECVAWA